MSVPIWMDVGIGEIPSPEDLGRLASKGQHVVLRIHGPVREGELAPLIARLEAALPEHRVFTSGQSQVTVRPVISAEDVALIADQLVEAAAAFGTIARRLCAQLACALELSPETLINAPRTSGQLEPEWAYWFHGFECQFTSATTGQVLDIQLCFGGEFGVLDPCFFHRFLSTTHSYSALAATLSGGFHDTARALDILEKSGRLVRIEHGAGGEFRDDPADSERGAK